MQVKAGAGRKSKAEGAKARRSNNQSSRKNCQQEKVRDTASRRCLGSVFASLASLDGARFARLPGVQTPPKPAALASIWESEGKREQVTQVTKIKSKSQTNPITNDVKKASKKKSHFKTT